MTSRHEDGIEVPQDGLWKILVMFLWPAIWYAILIYGIAGPLVPIGEKVSSWVVLLIVAVGPGSEFLVGVILLRREGYSIGDGAWQQRIRWRWCRGRRDWLIAGVVLVVAFTASNMMGPIHEWLAETPGFIPPPWWPALSDPRAEINGISDVFVDIELRGNFVFLAAYVLIGFVFNIVGEEVYYRGYLLPRMRGVFGRYDWVANAVLFTLKHAYQRWLYPGILIGGLAFSYAAGPLGSLPLAMAYHWIGNSLFGTVLLTLATLGY